MPATASLKRKASASRTIAYPSVEASTGDSYLPASTSSSISPAILATMWGWTRPAPEQMMRRAASQGWGVGEAAVEAVEGVEQRAAAPPPRLLSRGVQKRVRRADQHLADQLLP